MIWTQQTIQLPKFRRGCHLITDQVIRELTSLKTIDVGLLHVFILHTSASLTINENADPDVRVDMESALNHIVPESLDYVHTMEGTDDMPAHVKASLMGSSVSIPVAQGRLVLGTWQGIYLCEHRNQAERRSIVLTLMGSTV
jgi:secondary thiamine-phosphate synthase enzyme